MSQTQFPSVAGSTPAVRASAALAFLAPPPLIAGARIMRPMTTCSRAFRPRCSRATSSRTSGCATSSTWCGTLRLRRLKMQLLTASAYEGMHAILCRFLDWQFSEQVARQWALREQAAVTKAEAVLASAGLSSEAVTAQTLALKIDIVERIDRMMVTAEARRNSVLREIERHRASFARTLRRAVQDVEDAEAVEDAAQAEGRALTPIAADDIAPAASA